MVDAEVIQSVAKELRTAEEERSPVAPVAGRFGDLTVADAYAVQQANIDLRLAAGLPALTAYSITNPVQFLETLERIRTTGVSFDSEEASLGLNCVAAPIFNHTGAPVAAMSVSGPVGRLSPEALVPAIRAATLAVGRHLGYQPRSKTTPAAS